MNDKYGVQQHIITPVRKLRNDDLEKAALKFARDGIPLFTFDPDWDQSLERKYWTLSELTQLPLKVGQNELVKIWDSTRPDARPYKSPRIENIQQLVENFPNPPFSFFDGKADLYKEFLALQGSK